MSWVSSKLDKYEVDDFFTSEDETDFLGRGGFGAVRVCEHEELGKVVAKCSYLLKNMPSFVGSDPVFVDLVLDVERRRNSVYREGAALARINHINIVKIYGYTIWGFNFSYILEYVDGGNLDEYLKLQKQLIPWKLRLQFARQLISAINYLHNFKPGVEFVHGDIKSLNVFLTSDRQIKLGDFGGINVCQGSAAPDKSTTMILSVIRTCTEGYAAPETRQGKVSTAGDIYSYGVVLYEIVTSKMVYWGPLNESHLDNTCPPLNTDDHLIYDMLQKKTRNCLIVFSESRPTASEIVKELSELKFDDYDGGYQWELGDICQRPSPTTQKVSLGKFSKPYMTATTTTGQEQHQTEGMTEGPSTDWQATEDPRSGQ